MSCESALRFDSAHKIRPNQDDEESGLNQTLL